MLPSACVPVLLESRQTYGQQFPNDIKAGTFHHILGSAALEKAEFILASYAGHCCKHSGHFQMLGSH